MTVCLRRAFSKSETVLAQGSAAERLIQTLQERVVAEQPIVVDKLAEVVPVVPFADQYSLNVLDAAGNVGS